MPAKHRSGRFTKPGTYVIGRTDVFYRVFNSGEFDPSDPDKNAIRLNYGNGNSEFVILRPSFSIDISIHGKLEVVSAGTGGTAMGIYDVVPDFEVRTGRFRTRGDALHWPNGVQIVSGPRGNVQGVYRIFNSGTADFRVEVFRGNNSKILGTVSEDQSFDFVSEKDQNVRVVAVKAGQHIEGIYELIKEIQ